MVLGSVDVEGIHGGHDKYPVTTARFAVAGMTFDARVAVNDSQGFDAILGMDIPKLKARLGLIPSEEQDETPTHTLEKKKKNRRRARRPKRKCASRVNYYVPNTSSGSERNSPIRSTSDSDSSTPSPSTNTESEEDGRGSTPESRAEQSPNPGDEADAADGLPDFSEELFEQFSKRNRDKGRAKKRQRHARRWRQQVPLDGGKAQLVLSQKTDPTLETCR